MMNKTNSLLNRRYKSMIAQTGNIELDSEKFKDIKLGQAKSMVVKSKEVFIFFN